MLSVFKVYIQEKPEKQVIKMFKWPPKVTSQNYLWPFPGVWAENPFLKEGAIKKFGLQSFMGVLIGMFIGETLRINSVIEEGAGKLTSMAKPSREIWWGN